MNARRALAIFGLIALAVAARMAFVDQVFTDDGVVAFGTDPYYHLERVHRTLSEGAVPLTEPRHGVPDSSPLQWPIGFTGLLAGLAWCFGGTPADPEGLDGILVVLIPLFGAALVPIAFAWARRILGFKAALTAGALVAIWPGAVHFGLVGRVDHHVMEALLPALALLPWFKATHSARLNAQNPQVSAKRARDWAALSGVLLGSTLFFWPSTLLVLLIWAGGLGLEALLLPNERDELAGSIPLTASKTAPSRGQRALITLGVALVTAYIAVQFSPHGASGALVFHATSRLHLIVLAWATLAVACAFAARHFFAPRAPISRALSALFGAALGTLISAAILGGLGLGGAIIDLLAGGLGFVKREGVIGLITESRGLAQMGIDDIFALYGLVFFLWPGAVFALIREARNAQTPAHQSAALHAAWWLAVTGILAVAQQRFLVYAAIPLAVGVAVLARDCWRAAAPNAFGRVAALVALGALVLASTGYWGRVSYKPEWRLQTHHMLRQLAQAPPAADSEANAVLAPWYLGHEVLHLSGHPVVASPFVTPETAAAIEDTYRLYLGDDLGQRDALLEKRQVRWVLVRGESAKKIKRFALIAGVDPDGLFHANRTPTARMKASLLGQLMNPPPPGAPNQPVIVDRFVLRAMGPLMGPPGRQKPAVALYEVLPRLPAPAQKAPTP